MKWNKGGLAVVSVVLVVLVISVIMLTNRVINPEIKVIKVKLESDEAYFKAQADGKQETDFVRQSGITGHRFKDLKDYRETAEKNIADWGYYVLTDIEKVKKNSIVLHIDVRQAAAAIGDGGRYCIVDKEGYVLGVETQKPSDLILINGISLTVRKPGQKAADRRGYLEDALHIASIINEKYKGLYTSFSMLEEQEVDLQTTSSVLVIINLRFDAADSLRIAKETMDKGVTDSQIKVAGIYGFQVPDQSMESIQRGM